MMFRCTGCNRAKEAKGTGGTFKAKEADRLLKCDGCGPTKWVRMYHHESIGAGRHTYRTKQSRHEPVELCTRKNHAPFFVPHHPPGTQLMIE